VHHSVILSTLTQEYQLTRSVFGGILKQRYSILLSTDLHRPYSHGPRPIRTGNEEVAHGE